MSPSTLLSSVIGLVGILGAGTLITIGALVFKAFRANMTGHIDDLNAKVNSQETNIEELQKEVLYLKGRMGLPMKGN